MLLVTVVAESEAGKQVKLNIRNLESRSIVKAGKIMPRLSPVRDPQYWTLRLLRKTRLGVQYYCKNILVRISNQQLRCPKPEPVIGSRVAEMVFPPGFQELC